MGQRAVLALALLAAGCSRQERRPFRLAYFPNLTHAQALVGEEEGAFQRALGEPVDAKKFNAGPSAMEALLAGEIDASYVGSGPAINAFVRSRGAFKVIAGATSGGAVFVVQPGIDDPGQLVGRKVASPQLGNTQDISLRQWLKAHGMEASAGGGGDVAVVPIQNADILSLFQRKELAGAWVPEPWGARLVREGGGKILVDERTLWPGGVFATTVLVASNRALERRRPQVEAILRAHVALTRRAQADPQRFAAEANAAFGKLTGHPLAPAELKDAFSRMDFTVDPMDGSLREAARHAADLGFLPRAEVEGLVDRSLLDKVLAAERAPAQARRRPARPPAGGAATGAGPAR